MSRPSTAVREWPIPGRPGRFVRLHKPAAGKTSWRVLYPDGQGRLRERTSTDRSHAEYIAESLVRDLGHHVGPSRGHEAVGDLVDYYMTKFGTDKGWSVGYLQERSHAVRLLPDWFLETRVEDWRTNHSDAVLESLSAWGHLPGTREYERVGTLLSGLVTAGERGDFLRVTSDRPSPMRNVRYRAAEINRRGRGSRDRRGGTSARLAHVQPIRPELIPGRADVERYRELAATLTGDGRWGLHGDLLAHSGLRMAESLRVTGDDFNLDPEDPWVYVWRQLVEVDTALSPTGAALLTEEPPKSGTPRRAWFPPSLIPALAALIEQRRASAGADMPLFASPSEGFMRPSNWRKRVFNVVAEQLAWPQVKKGRVAPDGQQRTFWLWTPHSFRHYAATWMLKDLKIHPVQVAETLGHGDSAFTERLYLDHTRTDFRGMSSAFHAWQPAS